MDLVEVIQNGGDTIFFWMHISSGINPFIPNAPFLLPLKTSENRKVF